VDEEQDLFVIDPTAASDTSLARGQLRTMVEDLIAQKICDGPADSSDLLTRKKMSPHVDVPGRGLVSTQQLVSELNHTRSGAKLSKDRLTRVAQRDVEEGRTLLQVRHHSVVMHRGAVSFIDNLVWLNAIFFYIQLDATSSTMRPPAVTGNSNSWLLLTICIHGIHGHTVANSMRIRSGGALH
jgi:hypothetical protein